MTKWLRNLRKKLWPLRRDFTEREFYSLPIQRQRRILNLHSGQNPPKPSYLTYPDNPGVRPTPNAFIGKKSQ